MKTKQILLSTAVAGFSLAFTSCNEALDEIKPDPVNNGNVQISKKPIETYLYFDDSEELSNKELQDGKAEFYYKYDYSYNEQNDLENFSLNYKLGPDTGVAAECSYENDLPLNCKSYDGSTLLISSTYSYDLIGNMLSDQYDYTFKDGKAVLAISPRDTFDILYSLDPNVKMVTITGREKKEGVIDSTTYKLEGRTLHIYKRNLWDNKPHVIYNKVIEFDLNKQSSKLINSLLGEHGIMSERDPVLFPQFVDSDFVINSISETISYFREDGTYDEALHTLTLLDLELDKFGRTTKLSYENSLVDNGMLQPDDINNAFFLQIYAEK